VSLVDTDGIVILGPGSEWFWMALTGLVLAGTGVAIYRQLRVQQRQIHDNTKLLRSQAHYNALLLGQRPLEILVGDEALSSMLNVAFGTPEALSASDWLRCSTYMAMQFNAWEYFYYQYRDGSIPKELWLGADNYFKDLIATKPGYARVWAEFQTGYAEPFRSEVTREFTMKSAHADALSGVSPPADEVTHANDP
jgi:hypothetical protein